MLDFLDVLAILAMLTVLAVLGMGFYSLYRGGEYARANSNKFMRYRLMAQGVAIVILLIWAAVKRGHP